MQNILVTGGAGYIGSHTVVELVKAGYCPIIVDNFSNSDPVILDRLAEITDSLIPFYKIDVRDQNKLRSVFELHRIDAVIHFAGLKAVGESVAKPLEYYQNNLDSTLVLLEVMREFGVHKLIFSSSATVYGSFNQPPYNENMMIGGGITNPYGQTKAIIEQILADFAIANPQAEITCLRYFNPIGAHASGLIGENPRGVPNNLLPFVTKVATGELKAVQIFGDNYDTPDGTGVRDYIHVVDLADGHLAALEASQPGWQAYNLGTGRGSSVLEIVAAVEKASGREIPVNIVDRRPGDLATAVANVDKAKTELNWQAKKSLEQACADSWFWQIEEVKRQSRN